MIITVNSDFSSLVQNDEQTMEFRLPNYNPETQVPFGSEEAVEAYARSVAGKPHYFSPVAVTANRKAISRVEFKLLLTSAERLAIRAARAYSGSDDAQNLVKAVLDDFYDIMDDITLSFINLESAATIEGVQFLETASLIGPGRAGEILAGIPE